MEGEGLSNETYKECLRNHAASLGSYATDGCGEFTLDNIVVGELKCAACGCHRNFHRKISVVNKVGTGRRGEVVEMIEYGGGHHNNSVDSHDLSERIGKTKRVRTKFTVEQKEKMFDFAEKLKWKLRRKEDDNDDEIERFCRNVGVSRQVFKVWMHNHKNISLSSSPSTTAAIASSLITQ